MKKDLIRYAWAFNILGAFYRLPPDDPKLAPMAALFNQSGWLDFWPIQCSETDRSKLLNSLRIVNLDELRYAWNILFVGPGANPAPPWGSVYLDPEHLLHGESTQALKDFLQREQIEIRCEVAEPADHVGLMFYQAAFLANLEREEALIQLVKEHLYPWLPLYYKQHLEGNMSSFYTSLTQLALMTVESLLFASPQTKNVLL